MYRYDVYEDGQLQQEALTPSETARVAGINAKYVYTYAVNGWICNEHYKITFSGNDAELSDIEQWRRDFELQWQRAVAPFKKVKWSRMEGKKLHAHK